ncbi:MAG: Signal recognition particle receptor FtsY [Chlamydiia bacterium]|nr:Signal recognition particle receptor FtsY [Chlamydiia bacterium]MCH9615213.1 Signal recognition particle receptor FtsY [Chlamydiia bacterium]MCH9628465.1 Signal recognition particle receptor FtsY [Chlamydiia bacterium]
MFKFFSKIKNIFSRPLDEATREELEEALYQADIGSTCVEAFLKRAKKDPTLDGMKAQALELLNSATLEKQPLNSPHVILLVGTNGSGKTTTSAKLAKHYRDQGKSVLLAPCDTFRAAAIPQLQKWAAKLNLPIVNSKPGADPSSVIYDALSQAKEQNIDIIIADTAGRLESKQDLMRELEKLKRVSGKLIEGSPHETYLVLDATIGQNAVDQARTFNEVTPLTGIILTKFDGTAKGGIILPIHNDLKLPVAFLGTGEGIEDLTPFKPETFVDSLF